MRPADVQRFALLLMLFGATLELSATVRSTNGLSEGFRELGYPLVLFAPPRDARLPRLVPAGRVDGRRTPDRRK